jgi:hypothetical protein
MTQLRYSSDDPHVQAREFAAWFKEHGDVRLVTKPKSCRVDTDLPSGVWGQMVLDGLAVVRRSWVRQPTAAEKRLCKTTGARIDPVLMFEMEVL